MSKFLCLLALCSIQYSAADLDPVHDPIVPILKENSSPGAQVSKMSLAGLGKTSEILSKLESESTLGKKYVAEVMSAAETVLDAEKDSQPAAVESESDSFHRKCASCFEPAAQAQTQDPGWQQHCAMCYIQSEMVRLQDEIDQVKTKRDQLESDAQKEGQKLQALSSQFAKVKSEFEAFKPPSKLSPAEQRVQDLEKNLEEAKKELELERSRAAASP
jgi:chromosome segregation ATPase